MAHLLEHMVFGGRRRSEREGDPRPRGQLQFTHERRWTNYFETLRATDETEFASTSNRTGSSAYKRETSS